MRNAALFLLALLPALAQANDVRCLQSTGTGKPIQLQLTLFTTEQGWSQAGEVQYRGQPDSLPVVFKNSVVVMEVEDRPWEFLSTWLEVLPEQEKIGGRYQFHHQGAVAFAFTYSNDRSGKRFDFEERRDLLNEQDTCNWP